MSSPDQTVKAFLGSGDKRHALYVNAIVMLATAAITGFVTAIASPKPLSDQRLEEVLTAKLTPITYRLDAVEINNADNKRTVGDIQRQVLESLAAMSDRMAAVAESVARIDERTKKSGT